jgi:hypothetical protein
MVYALLKAKPFSGYLLSITAQSEWKQSIKPFIELVA